MKKIQILVVLALLAALAFQPGSVSAQKFPSYITGTTVQNLSDTEANIVVSYYRLGESTSALDDPKTIPANQNVAFFPATQVGTFNGSVVISSDQMVGAIVNVLNSTFTASASYVGASTGDTKISLPLLMTKNSGYDTWFSVQNAGTGDASVTIDYSDCPGTSNATATIKQNAAQQFNNANDTCHANKAYSAVITSTQPVVVVVMEENTNTMYAYTGFTPNGASTNPVMPLVNANNAGYSTGIQIQNTGGAETTVTVSYSPSSPTNGTACTETQTIPAMGSKTFAFTALQVANPAGITTNCVVGAKLVGSAKVTANTGNQPLVSIVNQLSNVPNGEAYGGFNVANATPKLVMPLIMDRNSGYFTAFNVMNVGNAATFVRCTLTGGTSYKVEKQLAPNEALTDLQGGKVADKYVGSGICTAYTDNTFTTVDPNGKIVAVVNELGSSGGDLLLVYEGINVTP